MSLDFQQVRQQVQQLGQAAPARENRLKELRLRAWELLQEYNQELESLQQKVRLVVRSHDPSLRCAIPAAEDLTAHFPSPPVPTGLTLLAADGSQIFLDRHALVEYFLVNVGTIQMAYGGGTDASQITVLSDLHYGDELHVAGAYPTEEKVSLLRDVRERQRMADLAEQTGTPAIALTDGPLELWGASQDEAGGQAFLEALARLEEARASPAGYVDKPGEDYVVRLLEIASQPVEKAKERPLSGVRDVDLFRRILAPGERSAIYEMQTRSAGIYQRRSESFAPHFFYLNVGREAHPWLARVDFLAWVANDRQRRDDLHAVLVHQCSILGSRPYPYALHRAHEIARVTPDEKSQLELMIANELRKYGIQSEESNKQFLKNL
jgi:hypothetical protein